MAHVHEPVLLETTVNALVDPQFGARTRRPAPAQRARGLFVDGTFGRGGHSRRLLERLDANARLIVFDKDPQAIEAARALSEEDGRVTVVHAGFGTLEARLAELGIAQLQGLLLDLGVSSPQLDDAERGFSFMRDGPLDMRMDTSRGQTAAQWLASVGLDELKEVISHYGEERFAFKIAKAIISGRESGAIHSTRDLAELIAGAVGWREKGQHPATRSFQAIRIHINQELQELANALASVVTLLAPGGRLAVISFHSLEDRMVKQFIATQSRPPAALARLPIPEKDMPRPCLRSLGRFRPDVQEKARNPRARSAVLRVAERTYAAQGGG